MDEPTTHKSDPIVTIRRQWNDWKKVQVRLTDLSGLHWDGVSGGVRARSSTDFRHGYIWCNDIIGGKISPSRHGKGPHNIKVCIAKKENTKAEYGAVLAKMATRAAASLIP